MTIKWNKDAFHCSNILNAFTGHRFAFCCNIAMGVLGRWGLYFWLVLPFYSLSNYPMRSCNNPVLATQKLCISFPRQSQALCEIGLLAHLNTSFNIWDNMSGMLLGLSFVGM